MAAIDRILLRELCDRARCAAWDVAPERFAAALERSLAKAFTGAVPEATAGKYFRGLHLEDLALACACEDGHEPAWEHFIREYRPVLYRAATAMDPSGDSPGLADALYGELYGLKEKGGERQSLFQYFHGRSSLATWLRSVLSQRHVDHVRAGRRLEPLPDEDHVQLAAPAADSTPDTPRLVAALLETLTGVIADLPARDRLRLACYYAQDLTLAQIGRLTGEHEATVSRHLTRTRKLVRGAVEERLARDRGMTGAEIVEGFRAAAADPGELSLAELLHEPAGRKNSDLDRSRKGSV